MNTKLTLIVAIVVIIIVVGVFWFFNTPAQAPSESPSSTASMTPLVDPAITLISPKTNDIVVSPILVTGRARAFENQLTVQLKDASGKVIYSSNVFTDAEDVGQYGGYKIYVPIQANAISPLKVEVFELSPKGDGSYNGYASVIVHTK